MFEVPYGLPKGGARDALVEHGSILAAWEVVAPTVGIAGLLAGIADLKGEIPVFFNASRVFAESFSSSHGLQADERGAVEAVLALKGARAAIDGVVFGIARDEAPAQAIESARRSVEGLGVKAAVHVQFAHRRPMDPDENERADANRIAESVVGAMAHGDVTVFLDNFTGIDRGYYFNGGLVDRLYNPLDGARIVRHLHAVLDAGCALEGACDSDEFRVVQLRIAHGQGALLLPTVGSDSDSLPAGLSRDVGQWIDLASGEDAPAKLVGPTLVLLDDG